MDWYIATFWNPPRVRKPNRHTVKRNRLMPVVERMFEEGHSVMQIAKATGMAFTTINAWVQPLRQKKSESISPQQARKIATLAHYGMGRSALRKLYGIGPTELTKIIDENPME